LSPENGGLCNCASGKGIRKNAIRGLVILTR